MIYGIIIFFVMLGLKLAVDVKLYQSRKVNNHKLGPALVFIGLIICSYLAGWLSTPMWFFGWWVLFDGFYNILIGQPWLRVGETAWLDRMQRKYHGLPWLKYTMAILSIILYIYAN